jgi:hypothetical protein
MQIVLTKETNPTVKACSTALVSILLQGRNIHPFFPAEMASGGSRHDVSFVRSCHLNIDLYSAEREIWKIRDFIPPITVQVLRVEEII